MQKIVMVFYLVVASLFVRETSAQGVEGEFVIGPTDEWKYHASRIVPAEAWKEPGYDDSDWLEGVPGFGYGDDDDQTILSDMEDSYDRVYLRRKFTLNEVPGNLYLFIHYDDAFIVYINGKLAKQVGINENEVKSHEADDFERFKLKGRKYFSEGENTIAIVGINRSLGSSDFSLWPAIAFSSDALEE